MKKMSIEISRSTTISLGNFNSIKPSVTIRMDNVDAEEVEEKTAVLSELVGNLWALEVLSNADEFDSINLLGFERYVDELKTKQEMIKEQTEGLFVKLQE